MILFWMLLVVLIVAVPFIAIRAHGDSRVDERREVYDRLCARGGFRRTEDPNPRILEMKTASDHVQGSKEGFDIHVFENSSGQVVEGCPHETRTVVMLSRPDWDLPTFRIGPRDFEAKMNEKLTGSRGIEFPRDEAFNEACFVKGEDRAAIRALLVAEATQLLRDNTDYTIESLGHSVLFYEKEALLPVRGIEGLVDLATRFASALHTEI